LKLQQVVPLVVGVAVTTFASGIAIAQPNPTNEAPTALSSWTAQVHAEVACASAMDDVGWEKCLLQDYYKQTKKHLSFAEYETNGQDGTWKVTWSHVVLPSGGKRLTTNQKIQLKLPVSVYCKSYTAGKSKTTLCNNGWRG
jgi:hypothetical protein